MKQKALFNVNRLVLESGKDTSPEVSFLSDLDYTIRKLNEYEPYPYFKEIAQEDVSNYKNSGDCVNVVCLDVLPKADKSMLYSENGIVYHTNDQKYYICVMSDGKPSRTYKPSSLHCIRQMYYQMIGADLDKQTQKSGDFYGICESGTDRHLRIQSAISKMKDFGIDCEYVDVETYVKENNLPLKIVKKKEFETKLFDEKRNLIFLCDGIIKYHGIYYILEIKTESSYKWMSRNFVDSSHKFQSFAYSLELGIDKVLFIYENRDVCTKKPYIADITDEDRQFISDRISKCDEYVSQHISPPVESTIDKKTCQYCDYKTVCKIDGR